MASVQTSFQAEWAPRVLGLLRIVSGYLFIAHGTAKLLGMPHIEMFDNLQRFSLPWIAGVLELFGGALLILGLFTRPVAFVLAGEMAVAYFQFHQPQGFWPVQNGGVAAALYSFVWLYFSAAGGGAWSLDRSLRGKP